MIFPAALDFRRVWDKPAPFAAIAQASAEIQRDKRGPHHMAHEEALSTLKNLVETCRDGQQGYLEAAEHISDSSLRTFFNEQSLERARYAAELESEMLRMGETEFGNRGSISGAIHRGWLDLSASVAGDDAVLYAVEQGEDTAKKAYEEAIEKGLPGNVEGTVRSQAQGVISAHDHVKLLRDRKHQEAA